KTVPQNGSCPSTDCTSAARLSAPRRKSTGRVAISTRTPAAGVPQRAGIISLPLTGAAPCRESQARSPPPPAGSRRQSRSRSLSRPNRLGFPPPPERNRTPQGRRRQPRLTETGAASRRAGCDEARGATQSHSSSPPVPGSPRQSPPSPHRSSGAAAAFPSEPPPDENCAHQLANYLAHHSPCFDQPRQQDHPIAVARRKVGVRLRLRLCHKMAS